MVTSTWLSIVWITLLFPKVSESKLKGDPLESISKILEPFKLNIV